MPFVQPYLGNRDRWPGLGALGAGVCCQGTIRTGGRAIYANGEVLLNPDDNPGKTYKIVDMFKVTEPPGAFLDTYLPKFGPDQRLSVSGPLLSDDRILAQGLGHMGPNEKYTQYGGTQLDEGNCPAWLNDPARIAAGIPGFPVCAAPAPSTTPATPEPPPAPFDGPQLSTISYDASTGTVTVYAADGRHYTVSPSGTPKDILEELKTTAPQGTQLIITGTWDPGAGTVAVQDWYIQALGEGVKKYGITPQGTLGPQSPDYPSTDWPGGLPPGAAPPTEAPATAAPTQAGIGWLFGLGLLGAALYARKRR